MKSINYNQFITRDNLNMDAYNKKIKRVQDFLIAKESNSFDDEQEYAALLHNPTTYMYLNFQIDGKNAKLYPYQDMIIMDNHRFKIFRAANQIGKSMLLDLKAARNLVLDHGKAHIAAIVSKSLPQSIFQMRRIKGLLKTAQNFDWSIEKGESDSLSVISHDVMENWRNPKTGKVKPRLKYTNLLICAPCTEGLLGYPLDDLNLDEFEYWEVDIKYFFNQIAQPRTYYTKGDITIFSNPNGQDSFVAELEDQITLDGNKKWHTYIFNFTDCPGNTQKEYLELKASLPRQEFESTVAAIRTISSRNYFSPDEISRSHDPEVNEIGMIGRQPIFFLDIGAKHDQCCLIGGYVQPDESNSHFAHVYMPIIHLYPQGYPLTRVAGVDNISSSDGWHHEKSVKEYLQEWSKDGIIPTFGYDVTGNAGMKALFESISIFGDDIMFSGPSKSGYYQRYKYFMEKGLIHRIKHKEWESQAGKIIVTRSSRGYLLINSGSINAGKSVKSALRDAAMAKRIPDDCMDATAGFIHLCDNHTVVPVSMRRF